MKKPEYKTSQAESELNCRSVWYFPFTYAKTLGDRRSLAKMDVTDAAAPEIVPVIVIRWSWQCACLLEIWLGSMLTMIWAVHELEVQRELDFKRSLVAMVIRDGDAS
jgi:hypothetical protein